MEPIAAVAEVSPSPLTKRARADATSLARVESMLRRNGVLASLGPETVREAARAASLRRFERGGCIWRVGETATHFQVVVSGIVKLVAPGPGMRPTILDVFGPGEALGHWAAFDGSPYIGDAMPLTEHVETLLVPAAVIHQAMRARPENALAMTHAVLAHARGLRAKIAVMCAGSVHQRLAMLLLDLNTRFGDELEDGGVIVPVPLSRHDLSLCVGATIETVIRAMSKWQKEAVLETHAGGFVLRDVPALAAVLEGATTPRSDDDASHALPS